MRILAFWAHLYLLTLFLQFRTIVFIKKTNQETSFPLVFLGFVCLFVFCFYFFFCAIGTGI